MSWEHADSPRLGSRAVFPGRLGFFGRMRVVLASMWGKASGRYSLIVLAIWILVSLISRFWTPVPIWTLSLIHI